MDRFALFPLLILLSGCNGPGLRHLGVAPVPVAEGGMTFDIRTRAGMAEAIRTNPMAGVRMVDVATNGGRAILRVTGCEVAWLRGDPAVLLAGLNCGAGHKTPPQPRRRTICTGTVSAPYRTGESDVIFTCG